MDKLFSLCLIVSAAANAIFPQTAHVDTVYEFFGPNETVTLESSDPQNDGWKGVLAKGISKWNFNGTNEPALFSVLQSIVSEQEVGQILKEAKSPQIDFDLDMDTVDDKATYEIYFQRNGGLDGLRAIEGKPDQDEEIYDQRKPVREKLLEITNPILSERILPFVNSHFSHVCSKSSTGCHACHQLIRRYVDGERKTHPRHFDTQALITMVVSLSSYGLDFAGGLYVSTGGNTTEDKFIALQAGDAIFHQYNLLHGVRVGDGERWSWIIWFKDSGDCSESVDGTWTQEQATNGDAVAQFIHAKRSKNDAEIFHFLNESASSGFPLAADELGLLYLRGLNGVDPNTSEAVRLFTVSSEAGEPSGHYNLGLAALQENNFVDAVKYFNKSAFGGNLLAVANMGVAYYNGMGGVKKDRMIASEWFERSGSSQWLILASKIHREKEGNIIGDLVDRFDDGIRSAGGESDQLSSLKVPKSLWLARKAASTGHVNAYMYVAELLFTIADELVPSPAASTLSRIKMSSMFNKEGKLWLEKARDAGSQDAKRILYSFPKVTGVSINQVEGTTKSEL